jgi:hypothetical protein
MNLTQFRQHLILGMRQFTAIFCAVLLFHGAAVQAIPQDASGQGQQASATLPADQLDSLVAPIALYPDDLLSQVLVASTYPLEVIQLQQWLAQHKNLKQKELADAVAKQDWDPSIQGLAALPDVVKQLAENIKWTTDLGNAVLAQQSDVMAAVQRMRKKAEEKGNLKSNEQQKVETKTVESQQVIVIEQANPQVVYVPSYNPTVVYGAPVYAYPPIAYPPVGYYAAGAAISFGVGVAMGAMWSGGWCCGSSWGGNNNITINNNNNFNRNANNNFNRNNVQGGNRVNNRPTGGNSAWQHNPQHRGGAPYSNRATADKFGGTARGDSLQNRQANARQNQGRNNGGQGVGGNRGSSRSAGTRDVGNRGNGAGAGAGAGNRDMSNRGGASAGTMDRSRSGGGGERVGNQRVPTNTPGSTNRSAFGGAGSGSSGREARASASRGSSSLSSGSRGGGGARGGGGRGGGGGRRR